MSSEAAPPKKQKFIPSLYNQDLPHFKFTYNLLYNSANGQSLADWLSSVDAEKKMLNWSDSLTIQKVLHKLKSSVPELHTWYATLGDVLTWEEWKNKLVRAFPDSKDYCVTLKRTLNRKRNANETFVSFLKEKTELLKKMNITGESAVSCILFSLTRTDIMPTCIARISNYKSPEELFEYFKLCDEKEAVDKSNKLSLPVNPEKKSSVTKPKPDIPAPMKSKGGTGSKKRRRKCPNCSKYGHTLTNCKSMRRSNMVATTNVRQSPESPANLPKPNRHNMVLRYSQITTRQPNPQGNRGSKPPVKRKIQKRPLCKYCCRYGHRTSRCPFAKLAELKRAQLNASVPTGIQGSQVDVSRSANQTQLPKCSHCGETNHVAFNCPHPKNINSGPSTSQTQNKKDMTCGYCLRRGHNADMCYIANRKAERNVKRQESEVVYEEGIASGSQEKECTYCGSSKHLTRYCRRAEQPMAVDQHVPEKSVPEKSAPIETCYFCGSSTHLPSACYFSSKPDERRRHEQGEQGYRQLLCLKCYKLGHKTEYCPRYSKGSYRN